MYQPYPPYYPPYYPPPVYGAPASPVDKAGRPSLKEVKRSIKFYTELLDELKKKEGEKKDKDKKDEKKEPWFKKMEWQFMLFFTSPLILTGYILGLKHLWAYLQ